MDKLKGYKTFIVFGVVLLNGILNQFGWGLELPPEWQAKIDIILSVLALVMRWFSTGPALPGLRGGA